MRIETIKAWMLVGFGLLTIGTLLKAFQVNGELGGISGSGGACVHRCRVHVGLYA